MNRKQDGWREVPLKHLATLNPDVLSETTDPDYRLAYVDIGSVSLERGIEAVEEMAFSAAPSRARRRVRDGDTIVSTVRTYLRAIAPVVRPPENLIVSTGFAVVRPRVGLDSRFLSYALRSNRFVESVVAESVGVSYPAIAPTKLGALSIWIGPISEQRAIADFLDRETLKIDALIAKQKELIERIEEKRRSFIAHASTKGLIADREFRNSGIEWIGPVPSRWSIKRVKHVAKLESGHTPSKSIPEYWIDCDIPWVSLNDSKQLSQVDYIFDTAEKVNRLGIENSSARLLPERAVVFTRDATVGLSAITMRPMAVSQHLIAWICGPEILPEYLLRVIYAMKGELDRLTAGATIKTIGMPLIGQLVSPVPPLDEQRTIVAAVEEMCSTSAAAIHTCEEMLARLYEHRAALITAAVTGQIEVAENMAAEAAA